MIILRRDIYQSSSVVLSNRVAFKTINHFVEYRGYRDPKGALRYVDRCDIELNIMTVCPTINGERVARS